VTGPDDAEKGKKWVEISIGNQTQVMWEGKKPIYATLISSGQAGIRLVIPTKHALGPLVGPCQVRLARPGRTV
jgi:hypothetical protein